RHSIGVIHGRAVRLIVSEIEIVCPAIDVVQPSRPLTTICPAQVVESLPDAGTLCVLTCVPTVYDQVTSPRACPAGTVWTLYATGYPRKGAVLPVSFRPTTSIVAVSDSSGAPLL